MRVAVGFLMLKLFQATLLLGCLVLVLTVYFLSGGIVVDQKIVDGDYFLLLRDSEGLWNESTAFLYKANSLKRWIPLVFVTVVVSSIYKRQKFWRK